MDDYELIRFLLREYTEQEPKEGARLVCQYQLVLSGMQDGTLADRSHAEELLDKLLERMDV